MAVFEKFAKAFDQAPVEDRTPILTEPGFYRVQIEHHNISLSKNVEEREGWTIFRCTFQVVATSHSRAVPVGTLRVIIQMINPHKRSQAERAFGAIKRHLGAVINKDPDTITGQMVASLEEQPRRLAGRKAILEVQENKEKPEYPYHTWHVDGPEWDARIVDMDAGGPRAQSRQTPGPSAQQPATPQASQASPSSPPSKDPWDSDDDVAF